MSDCLVIGGGIIGMMSARMLVNSGASVTLLDQRVCGRESSWAGGGIISPLYPWHYDDLTNELSFESQAVYETLCDSLHSSSGIDPQYQKSGLLMMDEFETATAKAWMKRYKISYESHPQGALFTHIAQVRNPRLLQALKADIINRGVNIVEHTQVESLITKDDKVLGVHSSKGDFLASNVVACSGAWTGQLLDLEDDVFPIKGQMIILKAKAGDIKHIILDQGRYIIPRVDGRILVGSTMEDVGFYRDVDQPTKDSLYEFAWQHIPALKNVEIEYHWSGFRPASKSGKVIVARDKKFNNLFINTGHFRNGLNMAPASANRITQLINE
ncbi:MAG TPA: FAD-dependent oxidoreductase [Piscirickettsiaceae bacterium]|nr:FAD-dependent oxidoreductase [Piscirickettsiaceae bacterium]